jgi:hypothetical protein
LLVALALVLGLFAFYSLYWRAASLPVFSWCWPFLVFMSVYLHCRFGCSLVALAFPCFHVGLFSLPLCGAAPTFLCRRKEK